MNDVNNTNDQKEEIKTPNNVQEPVNEPMTPDEIVDALVGNKEPSPEEKEKKKKRIIIIAIISIVLLAILTIVLINMLKNTEKAKDYTLKGITTSSNTCKEKGTKCDNGTLFTIQVSESTTYDFYSINDDGNTITLLMDENLGSPLIWSTEATDGPLNVIKSITKETKDWSNIATKDYTFSDESNHYEAITQSLKAGIPTKTEMETLGCTWSDKATCPEYLYTHLDDVSGYWLSTTDYPEYQDVAWTINKRGSLANSSVSSTEFYGIRPLLIVDK